MAHPDAPASDRARGVLSRIGCSSRACCDSPPRGLGRRSGGSCDWRAAAPFLALPLPPPPPPLIRLTRLTRLTRQRLARGGRAFSFPLPRRPGRSRRQGRESDRCRVSTAERERETISRMEKPDEQWPATKTKKKKKTLSASFFFFIRSLPSLSLLFLFLAIPRRKRIS